MLQAKTIDFSRVLYSIKSNSQTHYSHDDDECDLIRKNHDDDDEKKAHEVRYCTKKKIGAQRKWLYMVCKQISLPAF